MNTKIRAASIYFNVSFYSTYSGYIDCTPNLLFMTLGGYLAYLDFLPNRYPPKLFLVSTQIRSSEKQKSNEGNIYGINLKWQG